MTTAIIPLSAIPEVRPGDDLAALIVSAINQARVGLKAGDIVVMCQKVVSKAENRIVKLDDVEPSARALEFASEYDKDPALVEVALSEATEVLRMGDGHLITRTGKGWIAANSGIDRSNQSARGTVTLLPTDPDASARAIHSRLREHFGVELAVVITDTFGRPWRLGQVDFALGAAGMEVLHDHQGEMDRGGRPLEHTVIAVADQVAAAAGMAMGKSAGVPVVIVRGASYRAGEDEAAALVRPAENDLFK